MAYDKDKYYGYEFIKQRTKRAPAYMREEIQKLRPQKVLNNVGKEIMGTKISERLHAYIFSNRW